MGKMKKRLRKATLIALSIFVAINFSLAEPRQLTLEDAISIALENNADTKVALMEVKKAQHSVDEAFGYAMPTLDFSANYMHYFEKPVMFFPDFRAMLTNATYGVLFEEGLLQYDPTKFMDMGYTKQSFYLNNSYEAKFQASQILFNSSVFRGIGASEEYLDLSKKSLKDAAAKTILNTQKAFYGALLAEEMYEILKSSLKNAEENLKNVRALYEQGLISEYDLLQAEVNVENLRPEVLAAKNGLDDAKDKFKVLLDIDQKEKVVLDGKIEYNQKNFPEEEVLIKQAIEKNYQINTLEVKKDVDEAFIELDRAEYWPTVAAFANYSFGGQANDLDFMNYRSGAFGLTFSINLFKGLRTNAKVEQSTIKVKQTEEQYYQLKRYIKSEVKAKTMEIERAQRLVEAQDKNVGLAERAYKIAKTRYKEGTSTQLEVQNAELALRQARTNRLQTVFDYIVAVAELEKITGSIDGKYFGPLFKKIRN